MNASFTYITSLQYRLQAANRELLAFQSGEKYIEMEETHRKQLNYLENMVKTLKQEVAKANATIVTVRNQWFDIFEEVEKERKNERKAYEKKVKELEQRAWKSEKERDEALEKVTKQRHTIYKIETELEKEKGKNKKLTAQLHHSYENSSIPSSQSVNRKKLQTIEKKQAKNKGHKKDIKGMDAKNRYQPKPQFFCRHHKRC